MENCYLKMCKDRKTLPSGTLKTYKPTRKRYIESQFYLSMAQNDRFLTTKKTHAKSLRLHIDSRTPITNNYISVVDCY